MLLRGGEGHRGVASDSQTAGLATDNWHMFFFLSSSSVLISNYWPLYAQPVCILVMCWRQVLHFLMLRRFLFERVVHYHELRCIDVHR